MSLLGLDAYASGSDSDSDSDNSETEKEIKTEVKAEDVKTEQREVLANPFLSAANTGTLSVKPSFMQETEKICGAKFDNSVFQNPFRDKEDRKKAVLEQHVEMTQREQTGSMIGGKKVCWNFRKGRCRSGHNCKFAHDNDVNNAVTEKLYTETKKYEHDSQIANNKDTKGGAIAPLPMDSGLKYDHISQNGQKMMERMGWEKGRGLGLRQNGMVEPVAAMIRGRGGGQQQQQQQHGEEEEGGVVRKKRPGLSDNLTPGKKARAFHNKVYNKQ